MMVSNAQRRGFDGLLPHFGTWIWRRMSTRHTRLGSSSCDLFENRALAIRLTGSLLAR
jgi:hypothetical protein